MRYFLNDVRLKVSVRDTFPSKYCLKAYFYDVYDTENTIRVYCIARVNVFRRPDFRIINGCVSVDVCIGDPTLIARRAIALAPPSTGGKIDDGYRFFRQKRFVRSVRYVRGGLSTESVSPDSVVNLLRFRRRSRSYDKNANWIPFSC